MTALAGRDRLRCLPCCRLRPAALFSCAPSLRLPSSSSPALSLQRPHRKQDSHRGSPLRRHHHPLQIPRCESVNSRIQNRPDPATAPSPARRPRQRPSHHPAALHALRLFFFSSYFSFTGSTGYTSLLMIGAYKKGGKTKSCCHTPPLLSCCAAPSRVEDRQPAPRSPHLMSPICCCSRTRAA